MMSQIMHYIYLPMLILAGIPTIAICRQYCNRQPVTRRYIYVLIVMLVFAFVWPYL